ncbi:hypothetical protein EI94DRAFT_1697335 [Lactarius quietus]|nr:hypothetical protein EI94DRAFT_1697335 [Lactarius quietus]
MASALTQALLGLIHLEHFPKGGQTRPVGVRPNYKAQPTEFVQCSGLGSYTTRSLFVVVGHLRDTTVFCQVPLATFASESPELWVRSDTYCDPGLFFHPALPPGLLLSIWDSTASDHVTHELADPARLVIGEVTVVFCRYECTYGLFFFDVFFCT